MCLGLLGPHGVTKKRESRQQTSKAHKCTVNSPFGKPNTLLPGVICVASGRPLASPFFPLLWGALRTAFIRSILTLVTILTIRSSWVRMAAPNMFCGAGRRQIFNIVEKHLRDSETSEKVCQHAAVYIHTPQDHTMALTSKIGPSG